MSERDSPAEAGSDRLQPQRPNLLDRLRAVFSGGATLRDDLDDALADSGAVSPQERTMLKNVLGLHEVQVEDVMVPRADIIAVPADITLIDALATFRTAGHSRLPVHGDTLDDPRGMIHIRDLVAYLAVNLPDLAGSAPGQPHEAALQTEPARRFPDLDVPLSQAGLLRPVLFVPPSMPALDLLVKMQATRTHMALVIDEYGGTDGLASIEDIVEMIVGDIEDEHDFDERPKIEVAPDGGFAVDGRAGLEEVSEAIGFDLTAISDAEEVETLGGLISTLAGHVPVRGEIIVEGPLEFEILDADPRRVKRVRIRADADRRRPAED